ncbi:hypothetical protein M2323_003904 [Rhodoblastus acidophilus]|uniref:hypothetical protein n=1 Tax=Rhodoblastus acidophilus TaxID=1074 RepID=UPI0016099F9B|nr:hypothetical protein [Rhodoblastus acidophilus]MCW2286067.1 hypothetical protein [Rhodoblastus acidophilus]MCW2334961.1 hypothetical protein [Rhodoblastus acidophilus]
MDAAWLTAISALLGSAIGAFASIVTTWLTQHNQAQVKERANNQARLERIYLEFIEQASAVMADALLETALKDPKKIMPLYAALGKLRLFASDGTLAAAELALDKIIATYYDPCMDFGAKPENPDEFDLLRPFEAACREELRGA